MVFEKDKLKKLLDEREVKDQEGLQALLRDLTKEVIEAVFPQAEIQKCIVHQIRNSLRFVSWKERKSVAAELKQVYTAATEEQGLKELERFSKTWEEKYPHISKSWKSN